MAGELMEISSRIYEWCIKMKNCHCMDEAEVFGCMRIQKIPTINARVWGVKAINMMRINACKFNSRM
jgi:hypothetical protein